MARSAAHPFEQFPLHYIKTCLMCGSVEKCRCLQRVHDLTPPVLMEGVCWECSEDGLPHWHLVPDESAITARVAKRYQEAQDPIISWSKQAGTPRFQAVFFMGLPGSGKSYVKARKYLQHTGFKDIDPDEIKKLHPDYDPANLSKTPHVHEWSFEEAERQLRSALETGDPFILDGTGTDPAKLSEKIKQSKAAGYRTFVVYIYVPVEIALFRNRGRGSLPGGRWVPEATVLNKAKRQDQSFDQVRQIADKYKVIPNFEESELRAARDDLDLYPAPQKTLPPRPGDPDYGPQGKTASAHEEHSFVMFKPLAVSKGMVDRLKGKLEDIGANFEECRKTHVSAGLISKHYAEHRSKPFFENMVDYYTGKTVLGCRVGGERGLVNKIRRKLGPSDPTKCLPEEHIRAEALPYAQTGETCGVDNLVHASDSLGSAKRELTLWGLAPPRKEEEAQPMAAHLASYLSVANSSVWGEWSGLSAASDENTVRYLAERLAKDVGEALGKLSDLHVTGVEVQSANERNAFSIWFLPDRLCLVPIYVEAGKSMVYQARSGGSKGRILGWGSKTVAENLLDLLREHEAR